MSAASYSFQLSSILSFFTRNHGFGIQNRFGRLVNRFIDSCTNLPASWSMSQLVLIRL